MNRLKQWFDMQKAKSLVKKNDWGSEVLFLIDDRCKQSKKLILDHLTIWLPVFEDNLTKAGNLPKEDIEAARLQVELIRKMVTTGRVFIE